MPHKTHANNHKKEPERQLAGRVRASWRGMMRFGLVTFPVEAFNAYSAEKAPVVLHQLHAECHSRIRYQKTCPLHGPVPNDEIISGFIKIRLAEQLIGSWTETDFDFADYKDLYSDKVKELIAAKVEGRKVVMPEAEEPEVINLMEALKKSIGKTPSNRVAQRDGKMAKGHLRKPAHGKSRHAS